MLKETETEETIVFFVTFLSLLALQLRGLAHWLCLCEGARAPWNNIIVKGPFKDYCRRHFVIGWQNKIKWTQAPWIKIIVGGPFKLGAI